MFMDLRYTIPYLSTFVWIFPALRQYRTNLFFFFLILALTDPIVLATYLIHSGNLKSLYTL